MHKGFKQPIHQNVLGNEDESGAKKLLADALKLNDWDKSTEMATEAITQAEQAKGLVTESKEHLNALVAQMYSWIIKDPLTPFNDYALLTNKRYSAFALMHFSSQIDPQDLYGNNTTQLDFHEQLQLMWEFAESLASEAYQFALARM